jgi:putative mRNA 3-end processing factor
VSDLVVATAAGLYCPAGDFFIDPQQPVARAVISHAHADHARRGMGHYWAARPGEALLRVRLGRDLPLTPLDYGQPVILGAATVSLHPAGHILGSAQVRIETEGQVWVVSGDYKRSTDPSCAPFEPVRCDVFVTEATFARPEFCWEAPETVMQAVFEWWQHCKATGRTAVLFCYALGKAQRLLAGLMSFTDETVLLHGSMPPLVKVYRQAGVQMLPTEALGTPPRGMSFAGRLVLAPPVAGGTPWMRRFSPCETGFASGWMQHDDPRRKAYDRAFVLSDHADWPDLIHSIEQTNARRVLFMHGDSTTLLEHCRARGLEAAALALPA